MLNLIQRYKEGFRDARLYMRVWGDTMDRHGRSWRRWYAGGCAEKGLSVLINLAAPQADQDTQMDVAAAIDQLTEPQQWAVRGIMEGRNRKEMAHERGITEMGVTQLYYRARIALATLLKGYS